MPSMSPAKDPAGGDLKDKLCLRISSISDRCCKFWTSGVSGMIELGPILNKSLSELAGDIGDSREGTSLGSAWLVLPVLVSVLVVVEVAAAVGGGGGVLDKETAGCGLGLDGVRGTIPLQ